MNAPDDPDVTFIILSYKRPWNMERVLAPIRSLQVRKRVVISNNNPEVDLAPYVSADFSDVELLQQTRHCLAVKRFELARALRARCVVCVDDDIFLETYQIAALLAAYRGNPRVPHGIWGQVLQMHEDEMVLKGGWRNVNRAVDVLNRVYVFSDDHVTRFFSLLTDLGFIHAEELGHADDVLLSFCGHGRPLIHDLGSYVSCPSDSEPGVALWKESGFAEHRMRIYQRLVALTGRT